MRKAIMPVFVGLALGAGASPAQALPRFAGFVVCGPTSTTATHTCSLSKRPYTRFVDRVHDQTPFKRCIRTPSGKSYCSLNRTGKAGVVHVRLVPFTTLGRYRITFVSRGLTVRIYDFTLTR